MATASDESEATSRTALMSESAEAFNTYRNIVKKKRTKCCCCLMSKGIVCWNISMTLFNIFTTGLFISFLILTYNLNNAMMAYAIIQGVLRTLMNISGFRVIKILKNQSILYRNNNFLFLFGITSILFTIVFDVVFMVYINYIFYSISMHELTDDIVEYAQLGWVNIIWILDILIVLYSAKKYFRHIGVDMTTEYYRYKSLFWTLLLISIAMFVWGVTQTVTTMTGKNTIKAVEHGYSIDYYIGYDTIDRPKQMQYILYNNISIIYVCSDVGVYALIDRNNDAINDETWRILPPISRSCTSLTIDTINNYLYITEWEKTYQCNTNSNTNYANIHEQVLIEHKIGSSCNLWFEQEYYQYHGWHFTNMNKNNSLCISEGVACNICEPEYPQSNIICFDNMENPSWNNSTIWAAGVRDVVGFIFDTDGTMWFTDHNTDQIGDNKPDCELNKLSMINISNPPEHFGFPYCHSIGSGDVNLRDPGDTESLIDELYGMDINETCDEYSTVAIQPLGAHVAPNGLIFAYGMSKNMSRVILIAEHGSWNRRRYIGYRVAKVTIDMNDNVIGHEVFVEGWMNDKKQLYSGRPSHLIELNDGSILLSDDVANTIYRIWYNESESQKSIEQRCIGGHVDKIANWFVSYERAG